MVPVTVPCVRRQADSLQVCVQAAFRGTAGHKRCLTYLGSCRARTAGRNELSSARLLSHQRTARHICGTPKVTARAGLAPPRERSVAATDDTLDWDEEVKEPEALVPSESIVLPAPTFTRVKTADFVKSSTAVKDCPPAKHPEFAVIGRSNVGKSSLINMLTGKKSLAQISKTPGKTKCINHFIINSTWYLVDLPGYGYAKRSKETRLEWNNFTKDYLLNRDTLANVLLLIDASIPPTEIDLQCANWLASSQVPFTIVFTKLDKKKKGVPTPKENMKAFQNTMLKDWEHLPFTLETSSLKDMGRQELLSHVASLRALWQQEHDN